MTLPRDLSQATAADLHALVEAKASENGHLDFKRELPRADSSGKHELYADISAFANSGGGDVLYGIEEDGEGCAAGIVPLEGNPDEEVRRAQDLLMQNVEPRMPGLQVVAVPVGRGFVLVVRVPQSWAGPHRVKSNQHFYLRENGRKRQLDMPEIRGLFLRSERQAQHVRDFRTDRLGKLLCGEGPHKLIPGALLVLHLIPTQAALGLVQVDPVPYSSARHLPTLGTTVPYARLNLDGALGVRNSRPEGTHGYSLMFRNGFFEAVTVLTIRADSGKALLPSTSYETESVQLVERLRAEYEHLGVGVEMTCMLSLLRADQVQFGVGGDTWFHDDHQGHFDRSVVALPDVLLPADLPAPQALRPVFDLVWQSAGFDRSHNFDEGGAWAPRR